MNELRRVREKVYNTGSLRESTFRLWHLIKLSLDASVCVLVWWWIIVRSWQMKRLASCPGPCGTWQYRPCLLCTPGNMGTINTTAEVTTGPREIRASSSLSRRPRPSNIPIADTCEHGTEGRAAFQKSCSVDSLSPSPSRAKRIILLEQPQISAAQQLTGGKTDKMKLILRNYFQSN